MNHCAIDINISHHSSVHIYHCGVVPKHGTSPSTADKSHTAIAKAIIETAIKPYVWTPVARMPQIRTTGEAPIPGSPQDAHAGWRDPDAGHPVVPYVAIGPISRRPKIAGNRTRRLRIDR
jgi:hypothetical protein